VSRGRCAEHARSNDYAINRAGKRIYGTKRWKLLRRRVLFEQPLCATEGCDAIATDVHHKHGVENDPWSREGLEGLCHACHSKLTRERQAA
jgi:hypothetical protein